MSVSEAPDGLDLLPVTTVEELATRAETQSRNVKFDMSNPMTTKNSLGTAIFGGTRDYTGNRSNQERSCHSALDMRKPAFFFQDRDYFEAQKTWELKRNNDSERKIQKKPSTKRATDLVSSDDQRSAAAFSKTK